ncbi:MAG TPA: M67 family metallopeptidase [Rhizomicrobium sp.]
MTSRVELAPALADAIRTAAEAASPRECCGLLEGVWDGGLARVLALHPARNLAGETGRFEIAPQDHIVARKAARATGHAIIGCYHSHPGGHAEPSATDLAGAGEDNFLWLIAAGDVLNAFVYSRGRFTGADWVTSSA